MPIARLSAPGRLNRGKSAGACAGLGYTFKAAAHPPPHPTDNGEFSMYRMLPTFPRLGAVCLIALTIACSNRAPSAPGEGAAGAAGAGDAAADGSTLKVHAPTLVSPINDFRLDNRTPTFVANNTTGRFVNRSYEYEFELMSDGGSVLRTQRMSQGTANTSWPYPEALENDTAYRWRVRARVGNAVGPWSSVGRFFTARERRAPDPPPGQKLPVPDMRHVVNQIAAQFPAALRNSCQEHGGTWEFLDRVVDALRVDDTRWGYNCKRGNCGDPSHDVIAYHHLAGPTVQGVTVRTVDIISGHCGPFPGPTWILHDEGGPGTNGFTSRGRW
jgi:hypothetical protein